MGVPYGAKCAAARYAAAAKRRAVSGDAYDAGAAPPSTSAIASMAYGTRASSTVRDAPGTLSSQDSACVLVTRESDESGCLQRKWAAVQGT